MNAFDVLGDPVRRRILELLAEGEAPAGQVTDVIQREFGITQPAVSRHLRVLRESGFTDVRAAGTRRLYAARPEPFREVDMWLQRYGRLWESRIDALETELARGRRGATAAADGRAHTTHEPDDDDDDDKDRS